MVEHAPRPPLEGRDLHGCFTLSQKSPPPPPPPPPPSVNSCMKPCLWCVTCIYKCIRLVHSSAERAFIIDWRAPAGFDNILSPRYTNWNPDAVLTNRLKVAHVHDIGSLLWFEKQNASVDWYMNTKFDDYFTEVVEVVQAHSYDFTYALLRNAHFRHKISRFGMHNMKCRVCCMWNYLFKFSSGFTRQMNSITKKKIGLSKTKELLFLNVPFQNKNLPRKFVLRQASNALKCAEKLTASLKQPSWVLASNSFVVLEELPKMYPQIKSQSIFYTQERYLIDLHRENSSHTHQMGIPKTEQNALLHYFVGFFLQLNSTVLFSYHHSPYSETMAAYRYFHYPSGRYMVYPDQSCQFQRYRY